MPTTPSPAARLAAVFLLIALPAGTVNAAETTVEPAGQAAVAAPPDFAEIVARTSPAVVAIATRQVVTLELPPGLPEALADRLRERSQIMRPRESRAVGSGFFIRDDGYIVTNNHVVENASQIEVVTADGETRQAEVVGLDPMTDLAVLKIEIRPDLEQEMVIAAWGDSDALRPGAWTIAVGSPFGLGGTVTVGVLSARQRDIRTGPYDDFLQTDAAINVGNSGGPLFNAEGEVVGVNTAIFSPTGASVGIGFAVPSNLAARVVAELIETGTIERGFIGASLQNLEGPLARAFGYEGREGALVGHVEAGSPADVAGLRHGDVVLRLDGNPVRTARDLTLGIAEQAPGASVTLAYLRAGEEAELEVTVARQDVPRHEPIAEPASDRSREPVRLGLALRPVPDAVRRELGLEATGVIVQGVRPGGLGASGGLRQGDLIIEAGQAPVKSPGDVSAAWEAALSEERPLLLQIRRGGEGLYIAIED